MVQSFLPACMRIRHYVLDWLSSTEGSGRKLPSSREIAARFNVSQPTVVKALQELIREGFLINLPRVGIFSNPDRVGSRKKLWGIVLGDGRSGHGDLPHDGEPDAPGQPLPAEGHHDG